MAVTKVIRYGTTPDDSAVAAVDMGVDLSEVKVLNRDQINDLYVTVDGQGGTGGEPAVEGNDTELVPAGSQITLASTGNGNTVVRLVSDLVAVKYQLRGKTS